MLQSLARSQNGKLFVAKPGARLALFFYENLVAASVECSSRIVEVAR